MENIGEEKVEIKNYLPQKALGLVENLENLNKDLSNYGIKIFVEKLYSEGVHRVSFLYHFKGVKENLEDPRNLKFLEEILKKTDLFKSIPYGLVTFGAPGRRGACGGAWTIYTTKAKSGWGILLYEVALEIASIEAQGLRADTSVVSHSAVKVWEKYMIRAGVNVRDIDLKEPYRDRKMANGEIGGDITAYQLDDLSNSLTPDEYDNCDSLSSSKHAKEFNKAGRNDLYKRFGHDRDWPGDIKWHESPTNYRYFKPNSNVIASLKSKNLFIG
jgi:hypothetical protein